MLTAGDRGEWEEARVGSIRERSSWEGLKQEWLVTAGERVDMAEKARKEK